MSGSAASLRTVAALFLLLLAGCSGDGAHPTTVGTVTAAIGGGGSLGIAGDVCALLAGNLAPVFGDDEPKGEPESVAGGVMCTWDRDQELVILSVLPAAELQANYVDELDPSPDSSELIPGDGFEFAGTVSLGAAAPGGSTYGFASDRLGVLVAVSTGSDSGDFALSQQFAEAVAANL